MAQTAAVLREQGNARARQEAENLVRKEARKRLKAADTDKEEEQAKLWRGRMLTKAMGAAGARQIINELTGRKTEIRKR
jgi:hypothetical protein